MKKESVIPKPILKECKEVYFEILIFFSDSMSLMDSPLLETNPIQYCLDSSSRARRSRQYQWTEFLRSVCQDDAIKWRNQCAALLRRIHRIRDTMEMSSSAEDRMASLSPRARESAIEQYSIETGLDYDQSKLALDNPNVAAETSLRDLLVSTPILMDSPHVSDAAFETDYALSQFFWCKFRVLVFSNSLAFLFASLLLVFTIEQSWLAAIPLILLIVFALPSFPYSPSFFFKMLFTYEGVVLLLKVLWQYPLICDVGATGPFWQLFKLAKKCPPVYIDSRAMHIGFLKIAFTPFDWIRLLSSDLFVMCCIAVHLRSMYLSGRSALAPKAARIAIADPMYHHGTTRPTLDTYTTRFLLGMTVTVILITSWATISSSKLPQIGPSNFLGEAVSRNHFSAWQVLGITFFIFQLIFDRAIYIAMSHENIGIFFLRKLIRISILIQLLLLFWAMNLHLVFRFFVPYIAYLALSARQLAFDVRPVGNKSGFLWGKSFLSYYSYRVYLAIPFLDELRQICDWVATPKTSLTLFMWFKVEDCIANLRFIQAEMDSREKHKNRKLVGISALVGLVAIITGPLVFFSGLNVLREQNPIVNVAPSVGISSGFKIFLQLPELPRIELYSSNQMTTYPVSSEQVMKEDEVLAPLLVLQSADLQEINFPENSDSQWSLSAPLMTRLIASLEGVIALNATTVPITAQWTLARELFPPVTTLTSVTGVDPRTLLNLLQSDHSDALEVPNLIPSVIYLDSSALAKIINEEGMQSGTWLQLNVDRFGHQWWNLVGNKQILCLAERTIGAAAPTGGYSFSVIGLYLGVVLTVGRFLRLSLQGSSKRIDVEELPSTETLMQLCQGIEVARLFKDTQTEKQLYYDLVKVFRDPQLLMAATGRSVVPT